MRVFVGIDLGSTTTKAVILDDDAKVVGRGITNSRSNYDVASQIAREEAFVQPASASPADAIARDPELAEASARVSSWRCSSASSGSNSTRASWSGWVRRCARGRRFAASLRAYRSELHG